MDLDLRGGPCRTGSGAAGDVAAGGAGDTGPAAPACPACSGTRRAVPHRATCCARDHGPVAGPGGRGVPALSLGVGDYVNKNRFKGVVIGMSGGVDSALTACVAVDALGADG